MRWWRYGWGCAGVFVAYVHACRSESLEVLLGWCIALALSTSSSMEHHHQTRPLRFKFLNAGDISCNSLIHNMLFRRYLFSHDFLYFISLLAEMLRTFGIVLLVRALCHPQWRAWHMLHACSACLSICSAKPALTPLSHVASWHVTNLLVP